MATNPGITGNWTPTRNPPCPGCIHAGVLRVRVRTLLEHLDIDHFISVDHYRQWLTQLREHAANIEHTIEDQNDWLHALTRNGDAVDWQDLTQAAYETRNGINP